MKIKGRNHWWRYKWSRGDQVTLWGPVTKLGYAKSQGQMITVYSEEIK